MLSHAGAVVASWSKLHCCSLAIQLLGLLVERRALLDGAEALDLQILAGLLHGSKPWAGLGTLARLLAHNPACLVLHKIALLQTSLCLVNLAKKCMSPGKPCRDDLL